MTSAGGVEEDFVKCLAPFYVGDFSRWKGVELRKLGINRTGNIFAPNSNYVTLEEWLIPIFDKMLVEQNKQVRQSCSHHMPDDLLKCFTESNCFR